MTDVPQGLVANESKEIAPGVFWALLWCPTTELFGQLLRPDGHVLLWEHGVGNYSWQEFDLPVAGPIEVARVRARFVEMDLLVSTGEFVGLLPRLPPAIKAVQLGAIPPDYLDMRRIKGKELYRVLQECEWRVLIDTPANDYGQVMSPDRELVERAIALSLEHQR